VTLPASSQSSEECTVSIQLLSFPGCPHAEGARECLRRVLVSVGLPPDFAEIDVSHEDCPEPLKRWGSPTVLVNGQDVAGGSSADGGTCRLYSTPSGLSGVPPEADIRTALTRSLQGPLASGKE
jgi:mercuric ion transport protein